MRPRKPAAPGPAVRCAIYTRKSTEEGLDQDFNSLDAQRESGEAYVKSQAHERWRCLPQRYDDGGFTGGNMDRPALRRLLADIEAGRVDCVVVYKVDRLSRSLLDFARLMGAFERHGVSFVSVTQQFNTASSMGRLVLNVLLSFAQFEREIISERTRDKIAAARRKGKWSGGHPLLGYDIEPRGLRLVVNEEEAARVRAIFELYLQLGALLPVVQELERRGWANKRWVTRKGRERGGTPFAKGSLHQLLTNVAYVGKVRYRDEVHAGEHAGIVDEDVWKRTQALLARNGRSGGGATRNPFGALLKGVLRCAHCRCVMTPSHTTRGGTKRYRYYVCSGAQRRGQHRCPSRSIPAGAIERFVVEQIKCVGRDAGLLRETLAAARQQSRARAEQLESERRAVEGELRRWARELGETALKPGTASELADLHDRIRGAEQRAGEIREQLLALGREAIDEQEVALALGAFEPVWDGLTTREQARVVQLLVEHVEYDGTEGRVAVTFHPTGIKTLGDEIASRRAERTA